MSLILISLAIYIISFARLKQRDVFEPSFFLNLYFIILIGTGPIALYFFLPDVYNTPQYQTVIKIVLVGYIFINVGYLFGRISSGAFHMMTLAKVSNRINRPVFPKIIISNKLLLQKYRTIGLICIALSTLASLIFFFRAGGIPMLQGDKEAARVNALSVRGNGYFLYIMTIGMYGVAILYIFYNYTRQNKLIIACCTLLTISLLTGTGSRRYALWIVLYIIICRHYLKQRIKAIYLFLASFVGILLVNLFEMFRNPLSTTTESLGTTFSYRFIQYISNLEKVITKFTTVKHLEHGKTFFMDILTILPGKQLDYQLWLKDVTQLEFEGFGIPPTLMGDLYVNFGYIGIVIGCMLFGYIIRLCYNELILNPKKLSNLLIYILLLEAASKTITSGISAQSMGLLWIAVFYFFFRLALRVL